MRDPKRLYTTANEKYFKEVISSHRDQAGEQPVDYLYKTMAETVSSADYIYQQSRLHPSSSTYPRTDLGKSFQTIASLIFSDINTKVYYVSLGSFDTHINQDNQQQRLFTEMNEAVKSFVKDRINGRFNDVLSQHFRFGREFRKSQWRHRSWHSNNMFFIAAAYNKRLRIFLPI